MKTTTYLSLALVMLSTLIAPITHAKVNYVNNAGFSVTNESESKASVEVVYSHFIQHIDMWWPKDHTWWEGTLNIDENAGGCFCETHNNASAAHMIISYVEPNKKVVMTGGLGPLQEMGIFGALTWQFSPKDNPTEGTRVTMTYHASGTIHFNGAQATEKDAADLVQVIDKVQLQQLNALTHFSDVN
ncbi:SRPBCC family protein [Alteromonas sp. D210916BOD_24]|uniref:hypothetical protein n=1 Tax=Alteromonas sp. D210916BOD_24 TaxID=3157618 RepID=UPI00399CD94E